MYAFIIWFCSVLAVAQSQLHVAIKGHVCRNDTDCAVGQCCYIEPEFQVMSRRQALLPVAPVQQHVKHDTGVCENFHQHGERCSPLEKLNNHCGCGPGLSCQNIPPPKMFAEGSCFPERTFA